MNKGSFDFECARCERVLKCCGKQVENSSCINFVEREGIAKLEEYRQRIYNKGTKEQEKK